MEFGDIIRSVGALAGVLGVILLGGWVLRRMRFGGEAPAIGRARRLKVIESVAIDPRRRAVVLRWDDRDYLVVFAGDHGVTLADMKPAAAATDPTEPTEKPAGD